jgi:hypothetical protein
LPAMEAESAPEMKPAAYRAATSFSGMFFSYL